MVSSKALQENVDRGTRRVKTCGQRPALKLVRPTRLILGSP